MLVELKKDTGKLHPGQLLDTDTSRFFDSHLFAKGSLDSSVSLTPVRVGGSRRTHSDTVRTCRVLTEGDEGKNTNHSVHPCCEIKSVE